MRALVIVLGAVLGVSGAGAEPSAKDAAREGAKASRACRVELDAAAVRVNGAVVTDAAGVVAALGAPDRVERVEGRERYEEFGFEGQPPTSVMVPVARVYRVYDTAGVVIEAREGRKGPADDQSSDRGRGLVRQGRAPPQPATQSYQQIRRGSGRGGKPALACETAAESPSDCLPGPHGGQVWLHVLLAGDPPAHPQEAPRVRPTGRGCAVVIGGVALDPTREALPAGVGASSAGFEAFERRFGVTSFGGAVDSIYAHGGGPVVRVWFTAPGSGRPGWVRVALGG